LNDSLNQNTWSSKLAKGIQKHIGWKFNLAKNMSVELRLKSLNSYYKDSGTTSAENLLYGLIHESTHVSQQLRNKTKPTYTLNNELEAFINQKRAMLYDSTHNPNPMLEEWEVYSIIRHDVAEYRKFSHYINDLPGDLAKYLPTNS
jgi:hypothetical protein